jgi:DNA-binding transcriptional ArsR family regulator
MSRAAAEQDVFRAVAETSRRVILDALAEGPRNFRELHALLPLTKGTVSQHLAILVAVGLVSVTIVDRQKEYALVPEPLQELDDWLAAYRRFWTDHLEGLGEAMRRHRAARPRTPRPAEPEGGA